MLIKSLRPCFTKIFSFDLGSSIKLLTSKIENMYLPRMGDFTPAGHTIICADLKRINQYSCASFTVQTFVRSRTKCLSKNKY